MNDLISGWVASINEPTHRMEMHVFTYWHEDGIITTTVVKISTRKLL